MTSQKRSIRAALLILVGLIFLLMASAPFVLAGDDSAPPFATTVSAFKTNVEGTANSVKTQWAATQTAFKTTAESVKGNWQATGTAFQATVNAARSNLQATGTAAKSTLSAGATNLNATVVAAKTSVATQLAPITDPKTAIEYYAKNVLGITVTVVEARKATSSDGKTLTQTDAGGDIQKLAFGLASVNHYAKLSNGNATVSYGLGAAVDSKLDVALAAASVAVYTLDVGQQPALDANSALALAKQTFPKIANYNYKPWLTKTGWAWIDAKANGAGSGGSTKAGAGWIVLYVVQDANGNVKVTATVVVGGFVSAAPK